MLSISCLLLFISHSFAAILPPSSEIAFISRLVANTPDESGTSDASVPVCVNSSQHRLWESRDRKPPNRYDCAYAQLGVLFSLQKGGGNFSFYSKGSLSVSPQDGWELPFGAASGTVEAEHGGSTSCVVVIRMTRDFSSDALPVTNGSYNTQTNNAALIQEESWKTIMSSLDALQKACINVKRMSGWVSVGDGNIIAAIWPKESRIDRRFGYTIKPTTSGRLLQGNASDIKGDVPPA